jgi:hypothetical protein
MVFIIILLIAVGAIIIRYGYILWKNEDLTVLHDYHSDKLSDKNIKAFCTTMGIGIIIVGAGIAIYGILMAFSPSIKSLLPMAAGFIIGLAMIVYAILRYNR